MIDRLLIGVRYVYRGKIQSIDNSLVKDSLKILKGIRSRNNYCLVLRKVSSNLFEARYHFICLYT